MKNDYDRDPARCRGEPLTAPGLVARALAPAAAALLWSATNSYDVVLIAAIIGSAVVAVSFWFAVTVTDNKSTVINTPAS